MSDQGRADGRSHKDRSTPFRAIYVGKKDFYPLEKGTEQMHSKKAPFHLSLEQKTVIE